MGRYGWLRHVFKDLESNARTQAMIHKWACAYWLVNFPVIAVLYCFFPRTWLALGLFLNTFYSLYANLATDYDGLSSSQASLHAQEAKEMVSSNDR